MADLKFFNTLGREIQVFNPIEKGKVKLYTCGPTVYDYAHIGNFTAYVYWDTLVRTLEMNGYEVNRVMSMTDVGHLASDGDDGIDKLEKTALRDKKTPWEIADYFAGDFIKHFESLNCKMPVIRDKASGEYRPGFAKASDYIFEGLEIIKKLAEKGVVYATSDGLYFDTSQFPKYPDLAKLDLAGLRAGARVDASDEKRNPSDFAVWKFIKAGENHAMQWELPKEIEDAIVIDKTGLFVKDGAIMSYPGWHMECSAIIHSELGEPIDIHTGGIDHIPVHHTNEIAQSEKAFDKKLSNFWLHNNFITVEGEKMSKSKGNLLTMPEILAKGFSYMDFRMWVLMGHYQAERNFSWENLEHARNLLHKWRDVAVLRWQRDEGNPPTLFDINNGVNNLSSPKQEIFSQINDNLNVWNAISYTEGLFSGLTDRFSREPNLDFDDFLRFVDDLTGLNLLESTPDIPKEAYETVEKRLEARKNKDWAESDKLRDEIQEKYKINLIDTGDKTFWNYAH